MMKETMKVVGDKEEYLVFYDENEKLSKQYTSDDIE